MGSLRTNLDLQQLHEVTEYHFEDRLLISIYLCLAAGERNLVLRVGTEGEHLDSTERKEWVKRVGDEVAWICSTIFALTTHRVSCTSNASSTGFLRSLFPPIPQSSTTATMPSTTTPSRRESKASLSGRPERAGRNRSSSVPLDVIFASDQGIKNKSQRSGRTFGTDLQHPSPTRGDQVSFLGASSFYGEPHSFDKREESSAGEDLFLGRPATSSRPPSPDRRRSSIRRHTLNSGLTEIRRKTPSTFASPATERSTGRASPETRSYTSLHRSPTPKTSLSKSASISYLSPATSLAANQSAIRPQSPPLRSLTLPRLVPSETTPVTIPYINRSRTVSPALQYRPGTSRTPPSPTLLSALFNPKRSSTDQAVRPPTTSAPSPFVLPQILILEHLERTKPSVQQTLAEMLRERRFSLDYSTNPSAPTGFNLRRRETFPRAGGGGSDYDDASIDDNEGRRGEGEGTFILPKGFITIAIVVERRGKENEGGAWGGVSRYLFDHFSLSHSIPSSSFNSDSFLAPPLIPLHPLAPLPFLPLLASQPFPHEVLSSNHLFFSDAITTYISDLLSTIRHHPLVEGRMLTARSSEEFRMFIKVWIVLTRGAIIANSPTKGSNQSLSGTSTTSSSSSIKREVISVLPSDVLAVLIGVIGHRLKMRKTEDEKSMFWGSEEIKLRENTMRQGGVQGIVRRVVAEV